MFTLQLQQLSRTMFLKCSVRAICWNAGSELCVTARACCMTGSAFPFVHKCPITVSAAAQDPFSTCQSLFHWRTGSVKSITTCFSFLLVCSHTCGDKKMPLSLRLTGWAGFTDISVPIHAVDLLCDPQYIGYSHSVLHYSLQRPCLSYLISQGHPKTPLSLT